MQVLIAMLDENHVHLEVAKFLQTELPLESRAFLTPTHSEGQSLAMPAAGRIFWSGSPLNSDSISIQFHTLPLLTFSILFPFGNFNGFGRGSNRRAYTSIWHSTALGRNHGRIMKWFSATTGMYSLSVVPTCSNHNFASFCYFERPQALGKTLMCSWHLAAVSIREMQQAGHDKSESYESSIKNPHRGWLPMAECCKQQ